jgi:hypothetical protein
MRTKALAGICPRCNLVALDGVLLGKLGVHVFDEAARDGGR